LLLDTPPLHALLLGAILSSTDPVVLRDVLRNDQIPRSVRRALSVEAGMNDLVVLPIVLILIAVLQADVGGLLAWLRFLAQLLVLSPLVGGGIGAWVMGRPTPALASAASTRPPRHRAGARRLAAGQAAGRRLSAAFFADWR
jgi:NhaP-type Na+/H+ or K+/H+ antiporter